ncbi:type VI secretion system baseplate subunit TssK [Tolumonas lignilytica]|jgi:type VI secretion protein, VC_A0114 family|uniref:type VI secretion system baseplate subunit TssK n=1 Tax=Tolumonas lignilytica TaxID=1283284 RepID=UPI0004B07060|nr:type VI secretion system baseplate subunit TssK [Tolumonas lignilytica]
MDKVVWREGMLLRPQHLQQQDRYYQQQFKQLLQTARPQNWGFFELEIDRQYLMMGKIVVARAVGILPDGTSFQIDPYAHPTLDVKSGVYDALVYLALPLSASNSVENRLADEKQVITPFVSYESQAYDSNYGAQNSCTVLYCRHDFRLLMEQETATNGLLDGLSWLKLPLCRISDVSTDGVVTLDESFQPSFLHFGECAQYQGYLRELVNLLAHRAETLAERMREGGRFGVSELGDFVMLMLMNRYEPRLRHLLQLKQTHPERVFMEMAALYGELSSFGHEGRRPQSDVSYTHATQYACFSRVMNELRQHLSQVIEQHAIELPLQPRKYGILVAPLQDKTLLQHSQFVLAVQADSEQEQLRNRLPAQMKVGPVELIRQMVNLHLPGIPVRPLSTAPRQLPFHARQVYFSLELDAMMCAQLESSGGFALHVAGEFPGLQLHLWAIRNN